MCSIEESPSFEKIPNDSQWICLISTTGCFFISCTLRCLRMRIALVAFLPNLWLISPKELCTHYNLTQLDQFKQKYRNFSIRLAWIWGFWRNTMDVYLIRLHLFLRCSAFWTNSKWWIYEWAHFRELKDSSIILIWKEINSVRIKGGFNPKTMQK